MADRPGLLLLQLRGWRKDLVTEDDLKNHEKIKRMRFLEQVITTVEWQESYWSNMDKELAPLLILTIVSLCA